MEHKIKRYTVMLNYSMKSLQTIVQSGTAGFYVDEAAYPSIFRQISLMRFQVLRFSMSTCAFRRYIATSNLPKVMTNFIRHLDVI